MSWCPPLRRQASAGQSSVIRVKRPCLCCLVSDPWISRSDPDHVGWSRSRRLISLCLVNRVEAFRGRWNNSLRPLSQRKAGWTSCLERPHCWCQTLSCCLLKPLNYLVVPFTAALCCLATQKSIMDVCLPFQPAQRTRPDQTSSPDQTRPASSFQTPWSLIMRLRFTIPRHQRQLHQLRYNYITMCY